MAEGSKGPVENVIMFNLFPDDETEDINSFADELTNDEQAEVDSVVELLESVNSKELMDFQTQETRPRHISVDESELDRLAGKNTAQATNYQMKWAVTVLKGIYNCFLMKI